MTTERKYCPECGSDNIERMVKSPAGMGTACAACLDCGWNGPADHLSMEYTLFAVPDETKSLAATEIGKLLASISYLLTPGRQPDSTEEKNCFLLAHWFSRLLWLLGLSPAERAFVRTLAEDATEQAPLLIFADWLEEHGRTLDSIRVRKLGVRHRYLLFAGDTWYPNGGWGDIQGSFASAEEATAAATAQRPPYRDGSPQQPWDWWQVIDTTTGEMAAEYKGKPL